jgi:hypothetical protein
MRFPSKKDAWASFLLWIITLLMFAQCGFIIILSTMAPIPLPWVVLLIAAPLFFGVLLMSIPFWTGYDITAEYFLVRLELFSFRIPFRANCKGRVRADDLHTLLGVCLVL